MHMSVVYEYLKLLVHVLRHIRKLLVFLSVFEQADMLVKYFTVCMYLTYAWQYVLHRCM